MLNKMTHKDGQHVAILRGTHKKTDSGKYTKDYGKVLCTIRVNGDTKASRNLYK